MRQQPLDAARLQADLPGWQVVCLRRTGSTNDEARRLAVAGAPDRTAVLAEEQSAGRGRRGARWVSPAGRNGLVSALLRPGGDLPLEHWPRLTLAAALAGCDALEAVTGLGGRAEVKWPNDLYLSGRKVAGILVESAMDAGGGAVVIGCGFNLNVMPDDFPEELRPSATSVWIECGGLEVDRGRFLTDFLLALERWCRGAGEDFALLRREGWRRSWLAGKRVTLTVAGQEREGVVCGLGPEGELLLQGDDGRIQAISSADGVRPCQAGPGIQL